MSSILTNSTFFDKELPKASNCPQQQGVNDLTAITRLEYEKYKEYKKVTDRLEEFLREDDGVHVELKGKVERIISDYSAAQTLRFSTEESDISLLGIKDTRSELFEFEGDKLLEVLERRKETCSFSTMEEISTRSFLPLHTEDQSAVDHKNKLLAEQKLYIQNLVTLKDILEEMTDLRLKQLPSALEQNIEHHQNAVKLNYLKSQISLQKIQTVIFKETSISFDAYKELFKDIRSQTEECEKDIQDLMDLKRKYEEVACRQYDEILKQYRNVKDYIKKKKLMEQYLSAV